MAGQSIPLFKGELIRFTRVNSCGLPIEGPGNRVTTKAFVSVGLESVLKEAGEIEQENANGEICISATTAPVRKRYTATITMCDILTCLISKVAGWSEYLDYAGNSIGFDDSEKVDSDFGMAVEVWTGSSGGTTDCPTPTDDSIFTNVAAQSRTRGYLLFFIKEAQISGLSISSEISNPVITAVTFAGLQWGRGPYNVQAIDDLGTAGRMIAPIPTTPGVNSHVRMFKTGIEPPADEGCCYLAVQSIFTAPNYYFGGPAGEPAADIAPAQPVCEPDLTEEVQTVTFSGDTTLIFDGQTTTVLTTASTAAELQAALEALSNIDPGDVTVTGTAPGPFTITFGGQYADTNVPQLEAGTPANATITTAQEGGVLVP